MKVWLVGAGPMGEEYFKVLAALEADLTVIGRGAASTHRFEAATGGVAAYKLIVLATIRAART